MTANPYLNKPLIKSASNCRRSYRATNSSSESRTGTSVLLVLMLTLLLPGCLSLSVFPFFRSVKVETTPESALVEVFHEGSKIHEMRSPGRIQLFRSRDLILRISAPGYQTREVAVNFQPSMTRYTFSFASGVFCLFIPFGVDYLTGVMEVPTPQEYRVVLSRSGASGDSAASGSVSLRIERDYLLVD